MVYAESVGLPRASSSPRCFRGWRSGWAQPSAGSAVLGCRIPRLLQRCSARKSGCKNTDVSWLVYCRSVVWRSSLPRLQAGFFFSLLAGTNLPWNQKVKFAVAVATLMVQNCSCIPGRVFVAEPRARRQGCCAQLCWLCPAERGGKKQKDFTSYRQSRECGGAVVTNALSAINSLKISSTGFFYTLL